MGCLELEAVFWDMDGTLIDSEPAWIEAQIRLVVEHGGAWSYQDGLGLVGADMAATAQVMQGAGVKLPGEAIVDRLAQEVAASLTERITWRPGAFELVAELVQARVPQAIVTTSPRFMAQVVADALPEGAIRLIVGGEDVTVGKPDPQPYLIAASRLGVQPGCCLAVEDSPNGLAAALAAGMVTIGVPHDAVLENPGPWTRLDSLLGVGVTELRQVFGSQPG